MKRRRRRALHAHLSLLRELAPGQSALRPGALGGIRADADGVWVGLPTSGAAWPDDEGGRDRPARRSTVARLRRLPRGSASGCTRGEHADGSESPRALGARGPVTAARPRRILTAFPRRIAPTPSLLGRPDGVEYTDFRSPLRPRISVSPRRAKVARAAASRREPHAVRRAIRVTFAEPRRDACRRPCSVATHGRPETARPRTERARLGEAPANRRLALVDGSARVPIHSATLPQRHLAAVGLARIGGGPSCSRAPSGLPSETRTQSRAPAVSVWTSFRSP